MTHPPERKPVPIQLAACCPEAQADGVPCTELGRDCEQCEHAIPVPEPAPQAATPTDHTDPSTV